MNLDDGLKWLKLMVDDMGDHWDLNDKDREAIRVVGQTVEQLRDGTRREASFLREEAIVARMKGQYSEEIRLTGSARRLDALAPSESNGGDE